jgi:hypothetical protein
MNNQQNQKPINEYTTEELEKLELQLWRAKEDYQKNLNAVINDLNVITAMVAERTKSEQPTGEDTTG